MKFYTNIAVQGNNILFRGVNNGKRVKTKIQYSPTLFTPSKKETEWKTLFGESLEARKFDTIRAARDFVKRYEEVENFKIFGNDRYEYAFIADEFKGQIDWDIYHLSIAFIDIEVNSSNGFPDPFRAEEQIQTITITYLNSDTIVYGLKPYDNDNENVTYIQCEDEYLLLKTFLQNWQDRCPDVISGWHIDGFDIPYIINRVIKILGPEEYLKLSPWNNVWDRKYVFKGQEKKSYSISGVAILDYIELYRWYAPNGNSQESYKLDHIAYVELGKRKVDFSEHDNLHELYEKDFQKFVVYNLEDVQLVVELEDKLKLLELALIIAYDTKSNYEDVFAQTRMWDSLIYSYLLDKKIIIPPRTNQVKSSAFEGAYVKEPQVGMHKWLASYDLDSLYPHLLIQYNISPETLIQPSDYTSEMHNIISKGVSVDALLTKQIDTSRLTNVTLTPNGQFFRTDKQGFLPTMMEELYADRKKFKKMMLKCKQDYENETDDEKKKEIEKLISRYNNLQLAKKLSLNSAYGVLGTQYFRFYDIRLALGVTQAGKLSIIWIQNKLNEYLNKILKTKDKDFVTASDTDSIYLRLEELVDSVFTKEQQKDTMKILKFMEKVSDEKIVPYIKKSFEELAEYVHAYKQAMNMKRECLSNKGFWTAKKRYVMNVYNDEGVWYKEPELKIKGLEIVKSSTPAVVRDKMKEVVNLIVNTDEETVQQYILKLREDFKKLPVEEVSFPRGMNGLKEYMDASSLYKKGTPIHVKGAIIYNAFLKEKKLTTKYPLINEGEKLKFTYLKTPNPIKDSVIAFPVRLPEELGLREYINYDLQFEKAFLEPMKIILECIGWKAEKENSIESFF